MNCVIGDPITEEDRVVHLMASLPDSYNVLVTALNGKHHRTTFPNSGGKRCGKVPDLVHSDVCGKIGTQSLSGPEYFLTFIDNKTTYTWI